jgi:GT2 family glycosyltransferase
MMASFPASAPTDTVIPDPSAITGARAHEASARYDAVVSYVLYHTPRDEIAAAVSQALASPLRVHVVLVDNTVPELPLAEFAGEDVTIIRAGANLGYGAGHNLAFRKFLGSARYHFALNSDLTFAPDAIPTLTAFLDRHPDVGLAMPRVIYPDGSRQHLCRILPRPIDVLARGFLPPNPWTKRLNRAYEFHDWPYDEPLSFPFLSGCFMALRPEMLMKAGLFDERFFLFAEDLDLSRRIHRISQTCLCPEVTVVHQYRTQHGLSWRRKLAQIRSLAQYFNKYGWFRDPEREAMNRAACDRVSAASARL